MTFYFILLNLGIVDVSEVLKVVNMPLALRNLDFQLTHFSSLHSSLNSSAYLGLVVL